MKTAETLLEFHSLMDTYFTSFGCTRLDASRDAIRSFIPHLAQFTQVDISSIFVYRSTSSHTSWISIYFYLPLLSASVSVTSRYMTPMALLGLLASFVGPVGSKTYFYNV